MRARRSARDSASTGADTGGAVGGGCGTGAGGGTNLLPRAADSMCAAVCGVACTWTRRLGQYFISRFTALRELPVPSTLD